jgi:hypothetical protein
MMLLLGIVALQEPAQPSAPVVQRVWRSDQKDKYRIEIDFTDAGGASSNSFAIELKAPKLPSQDGEVSVQATYLDQTVSFGSLKKSTKGPFGTASLVFAPTGFPTGIVGKGSIAPMMAPMLAWFLPDKVDNAGKYVIEGYKTEDGVSVKGTGNAALEKSGEWKVANQLSFSEKEADLGTLGTTAWFEKKSGRLLRAQGTFKSKDGSAEFRVH